MHVNPAQLLEIARRRIRWITLPTICTTSLALCYALFAPRYWSASQALYIRDEGAGSAQRLGRFESVDAMQTAQETILEVARHQTVLHAALQEVGPYKKLSTSDRATWPSRKIIDSFARQVAVSAPRGAQFGRTELIYLTVKAENTVRAVQLTESVTRRLIDRMKQLRRDKYAGIVAELEQAADRARQDRNQAAQHVHALEQTVGADLAELRVLMNEGQGDGNLRRSASEITGELRSIEARRLAKQKEYELLHAAVEDPRRLIAMPSEALDNQPALKRLKQGLVDAQLNVSRTLSELNPAHPRSKAAMMAEQKIREQLFEELKVATSTLLSQIEILDSQIDALLGRSGENNARLSNLAELRTQYGNAVAELKQRTTLLEAAETELTTARAKLLAANAASLIQVVDRPVPSSRPVGPGRSTMLLLGIVAGLAIGVGLIILIEPVPAGENRRWSDHFGIGRRATDAVSYGQHRQIPTGDRRTSSSGGRRNSDLIPLASPPADLSHRSPDST